MDEEVKMKTKTNLLIGSALHPGREALHVLVRPDSRVEIMANDGTVVSDEPLAARHVMTLESEQLATLATLLRRADQVINP
jgi:hypothetical protein